MNATNPPPRLSNRYRLVEWIGEGGMGVVYRAHDEVLDRDVAIKFLSPQHIASAEAGERFIREARAVAQLSHPNIMALYDVGNSALGLMLASITTVHYALSYDRIVWLIRQKAKNP